MLKNLTVGFLLFCGLNAAGQKKAGETNTPRPITWKDVSSWKSISTFDVTLSPDGKWVAYPMLTREGDGELIVKKVKDTVTKTYPIGGAAFGDFAFSEDGRWLAYKEVTSFKEKKAAAKMPGKQLFDKVYLVELSTGKKTEFEKAGTYSFNGKLASYLALTTVKERVAPPKPDEVKGNDLLLVELATGKSQNIGNVGEFKFNKTGNKLAYTIDAGNKAGNGLYMLDVATRQTSVLDNDKASYKSLNWTDAGDAFAVLKMLKDEKFKSDRGVVLGVKNLTAPVVTVYNPQKDSLQFPKGMTISSNRTPAWTEDLTRLLFGISDLEPVKKEAKADTGKVAKSIIPKTDEAARLEKIKSDTSIKTIDDLKKALAKSDSAKGSPAKGFAGAKEDTVKPDMTIWHWQDKRLQSRQQVMEMQDKNFSYGGLYDVVASKFIRLNDSTLRQFSVLPKQNYALAEDDSNYELDANLDGQSYSDIYLIDLKTGAKTKLFEHFYEPSFASAPRPSPDGNKFVYGKDGQYFVYDITAKTSVNITEKLPTSFVNTDDDHNVTKPLTGIIGWSSDSKYVLVKDLWDIWQIPANGKDPAVNLTVNGRSNKVRYSNRYITDYDEKGIDLKKPVYLRTYGEWTKQSGIARLEPGKNGLAAGAKPLVWENSFVTGLSKAKNANTFLFSKETFNTPTEFYVAGDGLADAEKITKNTPDAAKYSWSSGTQLVDYISTNGDTLQGALFLPANYVKGNKYPTVVYYYEKLSQTLHSYPNPNFSGTGWNPAIYTSNGYAVFIPDIVYKMDDPGMSTVACVLPAVKAAIATGVIDEKNIGIHGHSWGGYQTCFLVTQTDMFKAAAAGAALTNMVSMYDLIYWNSGGGNMSIFEASQGRFKGAPWENWDSYLRNSPIYHVKKVTTPLLMLHNDKDGAVDFTQGIEFYNALRRLKKPVIMMQYKGENHGLAKIENRKDYGVRMMEFFDYYLKGKPAPDWLLQGVDRLKLDEHLNTRAFEAE